LTSPDLVLFTSEYPFGTTGETFLEVELPILAERFRRVFVLPSASRPEQRPLPRNAELIRMGWLDVPSIPRRLRALPDRRSWWTLHDSAGTYLELVGYRRRPRVYLDVLARNILKAWELRGFVRQRGLQDAIFYDYWFENTTLALAMCRREGLLGLAVSRAHGYDLYDEGFGGIPVPFRQAKARNLDAVFPISVHGAAYLGTHVPELAGKLAVHRLGVVDPGRTRPEPGHDLPIVVSCSALVPDKRVHLIPEVLATLDRPVQWAHLGDGPERAHVHAAARRHLEDGRWQLLGALANADVLDFYARNPVRALLSVSRSEGIPVSMMEAQSYGIPVVAVDVGAIAEIVTSGTGVLVPAHASPTDVAVALGKALEIQRFDSLEIRQSWARRYDGPRNYALFADALIELSLTRARSKAYPDLETAVGS
jgi:glycosyltransferase involved in cell wall biosynthesis